ncbi:helix-turn-helix domain-containing protein [Segnochrobactrum spirostomi]|nr:helix-turn-helix transcriptional regulator [Segnochrobactrum spirostomi]
MSFHDRLREWRESTGRTQEEMAQALEMSLQSYSRYERGVREPKASHLQMLSSMGCDLTWLVTGETVRSYEGEERGRAASIGRIDRDLWRQVKQVVRGVYNRERVRLPEHIMDDILLSKYNALARMSPTQDKLPAALEMIEAQLLEEMDQNHPDAAQTKDRA